MSWALLNIALGVFGAYLLHLLFEAPCQGLEKMLLQRHSQSTNLNDTKAIEADQNNNVELVQGSYRKKSSDDDNDSGRDDGSSSDIKVDVDSSSDSGRSSRKSSCNCKADCSKA